MKAPTNSKKDWKLAVAGVALGAIVAAGTPAFAVWCEPPGLPNFGRWADYLLRITQQYITTSERNITYRISLMEERIVTALDGQVKLQMKATAASQRALQQQMAQSAVAQIQAQGALEAFNQQERVADNLRELREKLVQPLTTCVAVTSGVELPKAQATVAAAAAGAARYDRARALSTVSSAKSAAANYDTVMSKFCSAEDVKRGRCTTLAPTNIEAGDVRAGLLFGDDGGTGAMTRASDQEPAVQAVIDRLTGIRSTPEALDNPLWEKTNAGKSYVETQRDYAAISQLASHSLQQIRMAHRAQAGLADSLKSAGVASNKVPSAISAADAARIYAEAQLSPAAIQDLAGATDPLPLLRNLAQTSSFGLWMTYNQMLSTERMEALTAAQTSLLAQSSLLPKANQQKQLATQVNVSR